MAYIRGTFQILKKLTPMLLKTATISSDVKNLLSGEKNSNNIASRVESIEASLKKQAELNEQINSQTELLLKLIAKHQHFTIILSLLLFLSLGIGTILLILHFN